MIEELLAALAAGELVVVRTGDRIVLADLAIPAPPRIGQQCVNSTSTIQVASTTPGRWYPVTVAPLSEGGSTCACPGFQYRGWCRHTGEAEKLRCGWHSELRGGEEQKTRGICPRCGKATTPVRLG